VACKGLAGGAGWARGIALLGAPLEGQPSQVAKLDGPGNDVGGNYKLVVENGSLIHFFLGSDWVCG
jgi:hypothetical protein